MRRFRLPECDPNPNVQRIIDFMLSNDGQEIIRRTGYAGLRSKN